MVLFFEMDKTEVSVIYEIFDPIIAFINTCAYSGPLNDSLNLVRPNPS